MSSSQVSLFFRMTKIQQLLRRSTSINSSPFLHKTIQFCCFTFLTAAVQGCHTSQQGTELPTPPFTLMEASSQNWTAGREEGGHGTEYYFKVALLANDVSFDSLWVDNKVLPAFIAKETHSVSNKPITYAKGDTIIIRGSASASTSIPYTPLPAGFTDAAAIIRYRIDGKPVYYRIEQIENKPTLNLPTRN